MSIIAAYCVPHPPIIIPEIGRGEERKISQTADAYHTIAREIAAEKPATIILTTPHLTLYQDYFHIAPGKSGKGSLAGFGAPEVAMEVAYDTELIHELSAILQAADFPGGTEGERDRSLDHASFVPLYFIRQEIKDFRIIRIGLSGLDLPLHYQLGMHIQHAVEKLDRRCVFIASGDLSHRLKADGPYGFHPNGPLYDQRIMEILAGGTFKEILTMDPEIVEGAGECGHRSFAIMAGSLDRVSVRTRQFSYEGPFGVGYGVVGIYPEKRDEGRNFLHQYRSELIKASQLRRQAASPLVSLALAVISAKLNHQPFNLKQYEDDHNLPAEFLNRQAGVFVSLKKAGQLRGCIGTIAPTTASIAEEVRRNALEAALADPRFLPVTPEEFPELVCSVDVLAPPEAIAGMEELDPVNYGVIVTKGRRRGLLLPNLAGVDTVEEQVRIAKSKAGIGPDEDCSLERFQVVRYE